MDNINWIFFGVFINEQSKKLNMDALLQLDRYTTIYGGWNDDLFQ